MLVQHPEWLRRPIVVAGGQIVVGYDEVALRALAGRL
jgi:arsenate reductase-like glutaredoxin family protein